AALRRAGGGILPIFAQQSIREMARTGRTPGQVMDDACAGAALAGYTGPMGAGAGHPQTRGGVRRPAAPRLRLLTPRPSREVDLRADDYSETELVARFQAVLAVAPWVERYRGRERRLATGTALSFTEEACRRAAVKYAWAIVLAVELAREIERAMAGQPYE